MPRGVPPCPLPPIPLPPSVFPVPAMCISPLLGGPLPRLLLCCIMHQKYTDLGHTQCIIISAQLYVASNARYVETRGAVRTSPSATQGLAAGCYAAFQTVLVSGKRILGTKCQIELKENNYCQSYEYLPISTFIIDHFRASVKFLR